jgi:hypothetical protein
MTYAIPFERDPLSIDQGRATVPMGRGVAMYRRFHPDAEYVWVTDLYGKERALTRKQADVYDLALTYVDRSTVTMRAMATILGVSPSTVSRALVKLAAFGLIGYLTGRGRYAGSLIFRRTKGDTFERFAVAARAQLKRWREAAERRFLRSAVNVALMYPRERREAISFYSQLVTKSATLMWTAEELADV